MLLVLNSAICPITDYPIYPTTHFTYNGYIICYVLSITADRVSDNMQKRMTSQGLLVTCQIIHTFHTDWINNATLLLLYKVVPVLLSDSLLNLKLSYALKWADK